MKANKFFALALAALAVVACKPKDNPVDPTTELTLDKTSISVKVDAEETITANIACEFTVDKADVVALTPANDGKSVKVKGLAEGTAIVTAKAGDKTKTCVVKVSKGGDDPTPSGKELKASKVWPVVLDGETYEANASKIVASFQPNDVDQFLYIWEETYAANENPVGKNFFGNNEGFTAVTVTAKGWAGMGYCLTATGTGWEDAAALKEEILANPDQYALHLAIKSTDNYSHCFYFMGSEATKFVLGSKSVYDGPVLSDFKRDGSWAEFNIEMADYATALAEAPVEAGVNVFVALTEGTAGAQLNLDAVYFYKK